MGKHILWVAGASLVGGLMVVAVVTGLRVPARAAEVAVMGELRASARAAEVAVPAAGPGDVVINEVAWMGTAASSWDEWIELYNTAGSTISLASWAISFADGTPAAITLSGEIGPHAFYLLERDNKAISNLEADLEYGGGQMNNNGEQMILYDASGTATDTANAENGGAWPAGTAATGVVTYATMERIDPTAPDTDANWCTNDGVTRTGLDAGGHPINGTPRAANSCSQPPAGDHADLVVVKRGPATTAPGSHITYTIAISNVGTITATAVRVTDTLPADVELVTQTSPFTFARAGRDLAWQCGDIPTGTQQRITVTGRVTGAGAGTLVNRVTATTTASETAVMNNTSSWTTAVLPPVRLYALAPANYGGSGEAIALINPGSHTISLERWGLNDDPDAMGGVSFPATATIEPGQVLWLAQDADGFYPVWGFDAGWAAQAITRPVSRLSGSWPPGLLADAGDTTYLLDADGNVVDAVAYGAGQASQGWSGSAVPYPTPGHGGGQVLYRKLDQATSLPVPDTDTAADWAQDADDPLNGRKVRYPGWDLEELFFPAEIAATAHFTLAVAPEGTLEVVSQTIASAQHTLRMQAYTLESVPLYQVISERIRSGVVVTILLESKPASGMEEVEKWIAQRLHDPPTSTVYFIGKTAPRYRFQHAKFILVDDQVALVSSDNLGENSMPSDRQDNGTMGHRGFAAATDSPGVIARLAEIFGRDCDPLHHLDVAPYDDTYAPPDNFTPLPPPDWTTYTAAFTRPLVTTATHVTVLHAPENALRDRDGLLGLAGQAGSGDQIIAMQMSEPFTWTAGVGNAGWNPRLQALIAAGRRGAEVRILLDEYYDDPLDANGNTAACLRLNGIAAQEGLSLSCRLANVTGLGIHAKVYLVSVGDERWVHVGSINGTENANKHNREAALQFRSGQAHEWMRAVFEHDWALGHVPLPHHTYLPLVMRDYVPPADHPLVSEVLINPDGDDAGKEWIELYNPGPGVGLAGWTVGDALNAGDYGDGRYAFPAGAQLARGQVIVVAACATSFSAVYGFNPAYEWMGCDATAPDLTPVASWAGFGLALGNGSDEVLLSDAGGALVDSAAWGGAARAGVTPFTDFIAPFPQGASLKRHPPGSDRDDCAHDFYVSYSPSPGVVAGNPLKLELVADNLLKPGP